MPMRRTLRSTAEICSRGHSGAQRIIMVSICGSFSITLFTKPDTNVESSKPGPNSRTFFSTIGSIFSAIFPPKSHSKRDCMAMERAKWRLAIVERQSDKVPRIQRDPCRQNLRFLRKILQRCGFFLFRLFFRFTEFFLPAFCLFIFACQGIYHLLFFIVPAMRAYDVRQGGRSAMGAGGKLNLPQR